MCRTTKFAAQFHAMKALHGVYYIVVVEDLATQKIIATGTLEIEHKFIHSAALRGRLEEVVIDKEDAEYRYTDNNLGEVMLEVLTTLGKVLGCYKISLESEDHLLAFYNKFGYQHVEGQKYMVLRYRD
ncbi:putative Glucosamine 6-phosphate N-acetyltransferase [Hypsibius exemplaris]|uniref:Glucosamine 6-phosphate N-acetyltransferase n=1 Tax=Hypsibius exemplaris TaxID=2072580 RepID=A0A9X6RKP9_HYPEX|nr:putative Glucosamine 6-phosphate N-acetyltransferase [Hypsibius exemplaris]